MKDKVVVITGASSGIGEALAVEAAKQGAMVVMGARNVEKLQVLAEQIRTKGGQVTFVEMDVTQEEDCKRLIESAVTAFGRIDVLINNAGISMRALFEELDLSVLKKLMDTNFWGTVYCTKYAFPYILQSKGSIVGVSSIAGFKGLPGRTGYSASKFAMHGFLESLRTENLKKGIHVMIACPGFTASNIRNTALVADGTQQGETPRDEDKMMSASAVAIHILKAIDKRKRTLVLTLQGKTTVLASKIIPGIAEKLVFNHMSKEPNSPF
ncbi:MAG: SDR family oxidoreductase [Lentimicrobiaceae bacterium]|jgi:short-subunit dehydrogenase|nr:SDR family oxidoreductase [Lentimicrobiaceae bacterium]